MTSASTLFVEYARCLLTLAGQKPGKVPAPDDPEMLSYLLATLLELDTADRQRLLQQPDSALRLKAEVGILRTELPMLQAIINSPKPPDIGGGKFSAN